MATKAARLRELGAWLPLRTTAADEDIKLCTEAAIALEQARALMHVINFGLQKVFSGSPLVDDVVRALRPAYDQLGRELGLPRHRDGDYCTDPGCRRAHRMERQ